MDSTKHDFLSFFLAEAAAKDIVSQGAPKFLNLAKFETILADIADCVIIFPESVGSWAETGFFSAFPVVQKKCLVVNCLTKQGASFLNDGPIQTFNETSNYRSTLFVDYTNDQIDFSEVSEKLKRYEKNSKEKIDVNNFDAMTGPQQLAFVFYMIQIFPALNMDGMLQLFKCICSKYRRARIAEILSILVSANYVWRSGADESLLVANRQIPPYWKLKELH